MFEYLVESGALGFYGEGWPWERPLIWTRKIIPELFTIVTKTTTFEKRQGHLRLYAPWRCVRLIPNGVVNAVSLTNPGYMAWDANIRRRLDKIARLRIIASINLEDNINYTGIMARMLNDLPLVGVQLNVLCPNFKHSHEETDFQKLVLDTCEVIKTNCTLPLLAKLSVVNPISLAVAMAPYVEAYDINSVPWKMVFPNTPSPLAHLGGGGVSGKAAQPFTWNYARQLILHTSVPIIGVSVWDFDDLSKLRRFGVKAIGFGSMHIPHPTWPTEFVLRDLKERQASNYIPQTLFHRG